MRWSVNSVCHLVGDRTRLLRFREMLVLACREESRDSFPCRPNVVLGRQIGVTVTEFPVVTWDL